MLLLFTPALSAAEAPSPAVSLGETQETYSFANPGLEHWVEGRLPLGSFSAMARAEHLRRFGFSDDAAALGAAWKGQGQGASAWAGVSPDATVLPREYGELAWDKSLSKSVYSEVSARASDYAVAAVYAFSAAAFWQAREHLEVMARVAEANSRFHNGGHEWDPGLLAHVRQETRGGRVWTTASLGWYKEAFEAGAPGSTGAFSANVFALEVGIKPLPRVTMRTSFEYEERDNNTNVHRFTFSAGYGF